MNRAFRSRLLRAVSTTILLAGCALGLVVRHALREGERELRLADVALVAHDAPRAIAHARAAAGWYVPFAPHVAGGYARLTHVARTSEAFGDAETALFAWRSVRSAAFATRSLAQPFATELAQADHAITRLTAALKTTPLLDPVAADRDVALVSPGPTDRGWVALLGGALVMVLWAARLLLRSESNPAVSAAARSRQHAGMPAVLAVIGVVLYAVTIYMA